MEYFPIINSSLILYLKLALLLPFILKKISFAYAFPFCVFYPSLKKLGRGIKNITHKSHCFQKKFRSKQSITVFYPSLKKLGHGIKNITHKSHCFQNKFRSKQSINPPNLKHPTKLKTKSLKKKKNLKHTQTQRNHSIKKREKETIFSTNKSIKNNGMIVFFSLHFFSNQTELINKKIREKLTGQ